MHPSGMHTISPTNHELDKKMKIKKYLSSLSSQQVRELYNMYKIDFEMFDYDEEEYLH